MDTKKTEDQYGIDIVHNEKSVESPGAGHHLENVDGATSGMEWKNIIQDAIESESAERELNWRQAIKMYPKAIFWSIAISLCIVMEGYDTARESRCTASIPLADYVQSSEVSLVYPSSERSTEYPPAMVIFN